MSESKQKKTSLFSKLLLTSIVCGTALGFSSKASAVDPTALYNNKSVKDLKVFAAGEHNYGVYAHSETENASVALSGEAISLNPMLDGAAVYAFGYHADAGVDPAKDYSAAISLTGTDFVALTATNGIYAQGAGSAAKATVTAVGAEGTYLGIYANGKGVDAEQCGKITLKYNKMLINAEDYGIYANGGNVTLAGNSVVNAGSYAIYAANGGTVDINTNDQYITVLKGKIWAGDTSGTGTVKAKLTGKDSSWTGNVAANTEGSNIEISLDNGATWNVVGNNGDHEVNTLTMTNGFVEMRDNQVPNEFGAALAKVTTLAGTKGTAHLDSNDTLEVGTITNADLTVYGGKLVTGAHVSGSSNIAAGASVNLNDVKIADSDLYVNGKLTGKDVAMDTSSLVTLGTDGETDIENLDITGFAKNEDSVVYVGCGGKVEIDGVTSLKINAITDTETICGEVRGFIALQKNSTLTIGGTSLTVNVAGNDKYFGAIHAGTHDDVTSDAERATVNVNATDTTITVAGKGAALEAMSNGMVNVNSNISATAANAILARGGAKVNINNQEGNNKSTFLNGNIDFEYDEQTSGTPVDADVNIVLTGNTSSWTGNSIVSYYGMTDEKYNARATSGVLDVKNFDITLNDGATWNVTKVTPQADTGETNNHTGLYQTAVNTLTMNGGTIDMFNAQPEGSKQNAAVAKVITLSGSKATVEMNSGEEPDTFEVATISNKDLTINGGILNTVANGSTVIAGAKVTMKQTNVTGEGLTVGGELVTTGGTFQTGLSVTGGTAELRSGNFGVKFDVSKDVANLYLVKVGENGSTATIGEKNATVNMDGTKTGSTAASTAGVVYGLYSGGGQLTVKGDYLSLKVINNDDGDKKAYSVYASNSASVVLDSAETIIKANVTEPGEIVSSNGTGLYAEGGAKIDVTSDFQVFAADAINAAGGTVNVNTDGNHKTVLTGNIGAIDSGIANINLTATDSSWTGNRTGADGEVNIDLGANTWTATKVDDVTAVNSLISNGGTIDLREAETTKTAKVAKVDTLSGSKVTVNMDGTYDSDPSVNTADTFAIGTNESENLSINSGILNKVGIADTDSITNNGVINLNSFVVVDGAIAGNGIVNVNGVAIANAKISNKMNVAEGATYQAGAGRVGNAVNNKGTVNLYWGTLEHAIIGGNVTVYTTVTSDASNFVDNTITVDDGNTLNLTGKITDTDKTGLFESDVKGSGTVAVVAGTDVATGNNVAMRTSQLGMSTADTGDDFTGTMEVGAYSTLTLSGDVKGLNTLTNDHYGVLNIYGDVSNVNIIANNGTMIVAGDVQSTIDTLSVNGGTLKVTGDVNNNIANATSVADEGHLTVLGDLNADITGVGITVLDKDIRVGAGNRQIGDANSFDDSGVLRADGKTIDMTDGVAGSTLTVGKFENLKNKNTYLKIDVALQDDTTNGKISSNSLTDKLIINAARFLGAEAGTIIGLKSVNITSDSSYHTTQDGYGILFADIDNMKHKSETERSYVQVVGSLSVGTANGATTNTYDIVANNEGKMTVSRLYGENEQYSVGQYEYRASIKQILENNQEKRTYQTGSSYSNWTTVSHNYNSMSLTGDAALTDASVNVATVNREKDIYLNGWTFSGVPGDSTIIIGGENNTLIINGGVRTSGGGSVTSTIADTVNLVATNNATLNFVGDMVVNGKVETTGSGATINVNDGVNITDSITNRTGNTVNFVNNDVSTGAIINGSQSTGIIGGTVNFDGGNVVKGSISNYGTGAVVNFNDHAKVLGVVTNKDGAIVNFNGYTEVMAAISNGNSGSKLNFNADSYTELSATITNDKTVNVYGILVADDDGDIEGQGTLTIYSGGQLISDGTLQQNSVELKNGALLQIDAINLKSDVINAGTIKLTGGDLGFDNTITGEGKVVLEGDVSAYAGDMYSKSLDLQDNNLTLKGGVVRNDIAITGTGKLIVNSVIVEGVRANANVLTVDTRIDAGKLTLTGGTLADGKEITGIGELVVSSTAGVTARVQDIGVTGGIVNEHKFTLTGNGNLSSDITGDGGDLIITGKVNADAYKIKQDTITIDGGELTIRASKLSADNQSTISVCNDEDKKGNLYLTGSDNWDLMKYINGNGTTHIGNGTDVAAMKLHAGFEINTTLEVEKNATFTNNGTLGGSVVNNEGATLNLNTKYTNSTAIQNAGTLNVDVANLDADVTNSIVYEREHDVPEKIGGIVNLSGNGTLEQTITGGTLNLQNDISANADNVAADDTYVADNKTLTLTGGTLVGNLKVYDYAATPAKVAGYDTNNNVVIDGAVVAEGVIEINTTVNTGKSLTIDADNVGADVTLENATEGDEHGSLLLGEGTLEHKVTGGKVQLVADVTTVAGNLVDNHFIRLSDTQNEEEVGHTLTVNGGTAADLNVVIGSNDYHVGTLATANTAGLTLKKAVWTDIANTGILTTDVANIKEVTTGEGEQKQVVAKKLENNGTLNLNGGTAAPTSEEDATYLQRVISGTGTTNFTGYTLTKNTVAQAVVDIAENASLGVVEDADLIATDKITNKGTLGIDAEHLKGAVENTGTLNLGSNKAVETPAVEELNFAISGDGKTDIIGYVKSNANITQKTVTVTAANALTMANDAKLTASGYTPASTEENPSPAHVAGIKVEQNAVLTVGAADLNGDVVLDKGVSAEKEPDNVNGKIKLGRADIPGTLNNKITGGDVELIGDIYTVGTNLNANELVNLKGNTLTITDGDLTVNIGGEGDEFVTGNLNIAGTTVLKAADVEGAEKPEVWTRVVVTETGNLTADADQLKGDADVVNANVLNLTGEAVVVDETTTPNLKRSILGTGTTNINGRIVGAKDKSISQKIVNIGAGNSLTMNGALLAQVNIAAAETGETPKDAGAMTIGASNLQGAVANNGVLNITDGIYQGVDENYDGFVASINGEGTTNINATAEGTVESNQIIKQGTVNVESGTFDMKKKLTATGSTNVKSGATMNIAAANIKGYVDNAGTINLEAGTLDVDLADTVGVVENVANSGDIYVPDGTIIDSVITNTGTVYTDGKVTMNAAINGNGETPEEHGWLVVRTGTTTFANTTAGSLNTNVEIKEGATLDPLARTFAGDIQVDDYGTLKVDGTDVSVEEGKEDNKLAATINVKGTGTMELTNGYIVLDGGTINQETGTTLQATGNDATTPVISGVDSADQLNVGGSRLELTGDVTEIEKGKPYALITGNAVKDVVAQDLLTDKKLWRTVEMSGTDIEGNPVTVSNADPTSNFVTDYFLGTDVETGGPAIVAEVRTIKSIDEINTNGLAGVQQGALAMTGQMNDKVAENMSLVERPAAEKGEKYDKQIWASYINTKEDVEDRELWNLKANNTAKYKGATVGVDFYSSEKAIAGLALSYATGDITANTANSTHVQNDAKYYGVTLYDRVTNGNVAWTYDVGYQNGKNEISSLARENITADVKTNAITAGIRVEGACPAGKDSVFAPFASVRYTRLNTGDYTNSNGSHFDSSNQNLFLPKVGLAWKGNYGDSEKGWAFNPILEIGYMFNLGNRSPETMYLSSTEHMFNSEYDVVDSGTYYGRVGMNFVNRNFSFGLNYRYLKGKTTKNNRWNVNLGYKF